jgi:nitrate reductase NapE component
MTKRKPFKDRYVSRVEHERVIAFAEKIHAETIAGDNALMERMRVAYERMAFLCFFGGFAVGLVAAILGFAVWMATR